MKTITLLIGALFILVAALATPIAIGLGLYDWVGNDMEFKFALWEGFKSWVLMLVTGMVVGIPTYYYSESL